MITLAQDVPEEVLTKTRDRPQRLKQSVSLVAVKAGEQPWRKIGDKQLELRVIWVSQGRLLSQMRSKENLNGR